MTQCADHLFNAIPERLGLGVGLDLPWGERIGFKRDGEHGDRLSSPVRHFLARHGAALSHFFFAFQPRDRQRLRAANYEAALDSLFSALPGTPVRALHHTLLNMGSVGHYQREIVAEFTNTVCERYGLAWLVEDLGIWSVCGKVMPYPLPPLLNEEGLAAAIANILEWKRLLNVPLSLEFPGFTDGSNFFIGQMDAFDFFRRVADSADVAVTLDVGHLLSYRWLQGFRGADLYDALDRLPLARCFEIHLSGCVISNGRFRDAHHGILLDEQLELLQRLMALCPRLRAITYEDPKFDDQGEFIPKSRRNAQRLWEIVDQWAPRREPWPSSSWSSTVTASVTPV